MTTFEQGGGCGQQLRQYRAAYSYPCVVDEALTKDGMRHDFDQTASLVKAQVPKIFTLDLELDTYSESKKSKDIDTSKYDLEQLEPPAQICKPEIILHYIKLTELEKNPKLNELLSEPRLNRVIIYVKSESRADELNKFLVESNFPSVCIHSGLSEEESLTRHKDFIEGCKCNKRILVATDVTHVEIDAEGVNIVINYDMPDSADTYLHRLGSAVWFGTKVFLIAFVASAGELCVLNQVPKKFGIDIKELPKHIDTSTYDFDMDVLNRDAMSDNKYIMTTFEQGGGRGPSLPYCYGAGGVADVYEEQLRQYKAACSYPYGYEVDVVTSLAPYPCVVDKVTKDGMRHEFDQTAILDLELDASSESKKLKDIDTSKYDMVDVDIPGYVTRRWEDRVDSDLEHLEPPAQICKPEMILHYIKLTELEKNLKLNELLSELRFNRVIIYVKSESRADELNKSLVESNFPSICIHSGLSEEESLTRHKDFMEGCNKRILVATDVTHVEIDAEGVNIVISYDMPDSADTYLYRLGSAVWFGTEVLLIAFVASAGESCVINQVPKISVFDIKELPKHIDTSTYEYLEKMSGAEVAFNLLRKENNELEVQVDRLQGLVIN